MKELNIKITSAGWEIKLDDKTHEGKIGEEQAAYNFFQSNINNEDLHMIAEDMMSEIATVASEMRRLDPDIPKFVPTLRGCECYEDHHHCHDDTLRCNGRLAWLGERALELGRTSWTEVDPVTEELYVK